MLNKLFPARFSGMNLRFFLFFLLFAYLPLLIFSIIGFFLNKQILKQVYQHDLDRCLNVWVEKYHLMTQCDHDLFVVLAHSVPNEEVFLQKINNIPNRNNRQVVGLLREGRWQPLNGEQLKPTFLKHLTSGLETLHFNLTDSSFYKLIPISPQTGLVVRYPLKVVLSKFCNLRQGTRVYLISLNDGFVISLDEIRLFTRGKETLDKRLKAYLEEVNKDPEWLSASTYFDPGWVLVYQLSTSSIYVPLIRFLMQIFVANVLLGILFFVAAMLIARSIARPIRNLAQAAGKISDGQLDCVVPIEGKDEIRDLAVEFERMRQRLLESYQDLEQKIEQRTRALREAQYQISHQEKMASLGILAAGVAHEIGNPLTSISSMAQIIKRKVKDEQVEEYINTILDNIERISKIVRELVNFSRPSGLEAAWVNVNDVIRNAIGIVKYDKRAKHVQFKLELAENLPNLFLVPDQLLQVILNMLINSLDALKDGQGEIEIRTSLENDRVFIRIKDNGVGIPPENLNKIFEPFFTTKEVGKGTGLGLSVSYGIIKNFKGTIDVKSEVGKGSEFIISLPVSSNPEQKQ